ncbi:diacylglycerol kinase family protein [Cohnella terricola]|uniref:Diacylglycerol kinase family protein n=1 Tax=Cohnella terricola TaxID=1289167 RepID=A0A559JKZ2_9BACL|nr:diacylglycerol kinase family protein [Cohnella terricola]TVY00539.1 diacylglycerol kinase family protein [Cohnella terricola]
MSGWRSREIRSFRSACAGIAETLRGERHMRFHLVSACIVAVLAIWLRIPRSDILWLLLAIAFVFTAELINTAIERTVDRISSDIHPLAKAAKDAAAGAVLVAVIFAAAVGAIVIGPPLWRVCFQ